MHMRWPYGSSIIDATTPITITVAERATQGVSIPAYNALASSIDTLVSIVRDSEVNYQA